MRARPIRPNIYLPVVRFGVADSDWFTVLLISCAGYLAPVPFGITLLYIPLQMWTWLIATAGSIAFFNYIRIGRKPHWLQHKVKGLLFHHRHYRTLPNGTRRRSNRTWIVNLDANAPINFENSETTNSSLLRHNNAIQEACDERWNTLWVTTN